MVELIEDIKMMRSADWEAVRAIYQEGIDTGTASFRIPEISWKDWDSSHLKKCRFVAYQDEQIVGWSALLPVSANYDMDGVGEIEVYVKQGYKGRGIGSLLLGALVNESEKNGMWMLQAGIFLQNSALLKIYEKAGFRVVGYREKIGKANGVWQDNLLVERRNKLIA
ncbi:phosphinothricin acetyltransferase [Pedobacter sp. Leaf216]|uniref:GNAT family N-acetyltransferase n=1 Tax=Pedobacter sp. Leaf216 TaxID=1735684 RepID=UPI0006FB5201|nr:GNAT family N-acetyltransferase [Pedobacter sp. Leaf216]KQM63902.1 phosphinothricin acetyltransferase [Pedobacter sp. Leaf216]